VIASRPVRPPPQAAPTGLRRQRPKLEEIGRIFAVVAIWSVPGESSDYQEIRPVVLPEKFAYLDNHSGQAVTTVNLEDLWAQASLPGRADLVP
jgi:hypothetical protein